MPMASQSDKIKTLNQSISDLQAQLIAKEKQIAFLQGQIFNFQWIIKHGDGDNLSETDFPGWDEFDDLGYGDDFADT